MVIVNTVVIVRGLGPAFGQRDVALTLAAFGAGSMLAAFSLPQLLDRISDRVIMIGAAVALAFGMAALAVMSSVMLLNRSYWHALIVAWFLLGIVYSMSVTPSGRLLRRSATADDRPALFAAQFALSHVCWLIAYPLAGQIGARTGMSEAFWTMAVLAGIGSIAALCLWPCEAAVSH
jgi:predicted MFS family arabinose efflux permease